MKKRKTVDINEAFETTLSCALHYAVQSTRPSYLSPFMAGYIAPLLPFLSANCLSDMEHSIVMEIRYMNRRRDADQDARIWTELLSEIVKEKNRRK